MSYLKKALAVYLCLKQKPKAVFGVRQSCPSDGFRTLVDENPEKINFSKYYVCC